MGSLSRQKGKRGERQCAAELNALLGAAVNARRGCQFKGGNDSPDVAINAEIHIEAKRVEALQLYPALEQATRDAPAGRVPCVWHCRNRKPSVLIVETARALEFARALVAAAESGRFLLTEAEREAIEVCAEAASNCGGFGTGPAIYQGDKIAATLRGLLERTKPKKAPPG